MAETKPPKQVKKYKLTLNPRINADGVHYKGAFIETGEIVEVTKAEALKMVVRKHGNLPLWIKGDYSEGKAMQEADKAKKVAEAILQTMEEGEN